MKITNKRATELAREGLKIRRQAMIQTKPCIIVIYMYDDEFYIANIENYNALENKNTVVTLKTLDVRYEDTIKGMSYAIRESINTRNRM